MKIFIVISLLLSHHLIFAFNYGGVQRTRDNRRYQAVENVQPGNGRNYQFSYNSRAYADNEQSSKANKQQARYVEMEIDQDPQQPPVMYIIESDDQQPTQQQQPPMQQQQHEMPKQSIQVAGISDEKMEDPMKGMTLMPMQPSTGEEQPPAANGNGEVRGGRYFAYEQQIDHQEPPAEMNPPLEDVYPSIPVGRSNAHRYSSMPEMPTKSYRFEDPSKTSPTPNTKVGRNFPRKIAAPTEINEEQQFKPMTKVNQQSYRNGKTNDMSVRYFMEKKPMAPTNGQALTAPSDETAKTHTNGNGYRNVYFEQNGKTMPSSQNVFRAYTNGQRFYEKDKDTHEIPLMGTPVDDQINDAPMTQKPDVFDPQMPTQEMSQPQMPDTSPPPTPSFPAAPPPPPPPPMPPTTEMTPSMNGGVKTNGYRKYPTYRMKTTTTRNGYRNGAKTPPTQFTLDDQQHKETPSKTVKPKPFGLPASRQTTRYAQRFVSPAQVSHANAYKFRRFY